jgi:hypothetical protein
MIKRIDTFWFEIAVIATIAAVGNILFGHFEQGTPKWPRLTKAWWLPKHGINGLTGEPKDKYYELRGWKR